MSAKLLRVRRWSGAIALVALLPILVLAWVERGYAPRVRIKQNITPLAFSPKGDVLAVTTNGGNPGDPPLGAVRFLSPMDGSEVQPALPILEEPTPVDSGDYSPDGKRFAVLRKYGHGTMQLEVFDLATRMLILKQQILYNAYTGSGGPEGQITFGFSPDSSFLFWSGQRVENHNWSRVVGVVDLTTGKERFALEKTGAPAVSPDSRLVATISDVPPNTSATLDLKLWNAQSGQLERSIPMAQGGYFRSPVFSPDGRFVAFSGSASKTEMFDTASGERVIENQGWSAQFLAEGNTLMMASGFDVQLWDTTTWKLKGAHKFDNLGRDFWTGDPITPWTQAIPGKPQVAVFSIHATYYWPVLRWLGRVGRLNTFGTGQMTLIDATKGTRQRIELHEVGAVATRETPYGHRNVWSPDGDTLALTMRFTGEVVVWDLPPQPSYVAPIFATALAVVAVIVMLLLRWRTNRGRSPSTAPSATVIAADGCGSLSEPRRRER